MSMPENREDKKITLCPMLSDEEAAAIARETLKHLVLEYKPGEVMKDGTVFAGLTADGKQIFAMPGDLDVTMTFNKAAKRVKELNAQNAYGHNDWVIPEKSTLHTVLNNKDKGALANTFKTSSGSGSGYPDWYWSSSEDPDDRVFVYIVRSTDGDEDWDLRANVRLSCRPVRLVAPVARVPK